MIAATGRSGTTTMMQLLGSSPQIVFDRVYAYENAYLSYLLALARLPTEGVRSSEGWRRAAVDVETFIERNGVMGGFPWSPQPSITTAGPGFTHEMLSASWEVFVRRALAYADELGASRSKPLYYAETAPLWVTDRIGASLGGRSIVLVRDPRDQYLSIMAFNAKRGRLSFGVKETDTPETYAARFADRQKPYLERALEVNGSSDGAATVLRFEDLTRDRNAAAAQLTSWLGVELSPDVEIDHHAEHRTSVESDGPRWKSEMDAGILAIFRDRLEHEVDALGWGW